MNSTNQSKLAKSKANRIGAIVRAFAKRGEPVPKKLMKFRERFRPHLRKDAKFEGLDKLIEEFDQYDKTIGLQKVGRRSKIGEKKVSYLWKMSFAAIKQVESCAEREGLSQSEWIRLKVEQLIESECVPGVNASRGVEKKVVRLEIGLMRQVAELAEKYDIPKRYVFEAAVLSILKEK